MRISRRSFMISVLAGGVIIATRSGSLFAKDKKEDEWEKLGELSVGKHEDHDTIEVSGKGKFTALRFRVEEGDIEIDHIKIVFGDDKSFSPETKLVFKEGERSSDIDLPGGKRTIKAIHFEYRSLGKKQAVIVVRGKAA